MIRPIRRFFRRLRRAQAMLRCDWSTVDGDWSSIAQVMIHAIRRNRLAMEDNKLIVGYERSCRQQLIAETLLRRMIDEPYFDYAEARFPDKGPRWALRVSELETQDAEMLGRLITKYLRTWWD